MPRVYSSYLIRCWRLVDGAGRVEVEHIQSGQRTRVASLGAALRWIEAGPPVPLDGAGPERGVPGEVPVESVADFDSEVLP